MNSCDRAPGRYGYREIGERIGRSEDWVADRMRRLPSALAAQVLKSAGDELDMDYGRGSSSSWRADLPSERKALLQKSCDPGRTWKTRSLRSLTARGS